MNIDMVKSLCRECIAEGEALLSTTWVDDYRGHNFIVLNPETYVDLEGFKKWKSNCNVLLNLLGDLSKPWDESLEGKKGNKLINVKNMPGALKSMEQTIERGYLIQIEDLVYAEAFSNLIDQAKYLYDKGFHIASGVLGRAVLEEKLRNLCTSVEINFTKKRPTL